MPTTKQSSLESSPAVLDNWMHRADEYARKEPTKAVISAFGAGILLNMLPLRTIAGAVVGIAMYSVRPALLFLGLVKACEFCSSQTPSSPIQKSHE